MELMEAISTRRSIRKYRTDPVPREIIEKLLFEATLAPSGSNLQPWSFVVIQNKKLLKNYSDRAKELFINALTGRPDPQNYRKMLSNPDFNIFYNAGTLIGIYGNNQIPSAKEDCCLAAQNLMLSAHAIGLGTCWIGFSQLLLDDPEIKAELGIAKEYTLVAPLILGYPETVPQGYSRKPPQILVWKNETE